jgi:putative protease
MAMDAYLADPARFDPQPYLEELLTVRSRGYTLGFHDGRPSHLAEDRSYGQSLSEWEFAGLVRGWDGDELIVEVKIRLTSGVVLEFVLPGQLGGARLRLYEFFPAQGGPSTQKVSAGEGRAIRILAGAFHMRAIGAGQLPAGTVVRKGTPLSDEQTAFLQQNQRSFDVQQQLVPEQSLTLRRTGAATGKAPRIGAEGCCGLGCNGCLPFWNEPKFAKARQRLRLSGPGVRLDAPLA